jgi:hypothetical protein
MHLKSVVCVSLLWSSAVFASQPRIDQEQPAVDHASVFTWAIGAGSHQKLAQVFTAGQSGRLTHVTAPIACDPAATITVEIQKVIDGLPSGAVLASETESGAMYPPYTPPYSTVPDAGFRLVEFQPSQTVVAGTQYAIVFSAIGDCSMLPAPAGDFYTGGHAYFDALPNPPGWLPLGASDDLPFQTFVVPRGR